ncbi:MAG: oligopeptide transporter, OPT family [Chlamydiae bacterium]|nr:oligopeptide transporter, OPT family [Chlamydiota bacterium]
MSEFKPYIPSKSKIREFSLRAIILGLIFGVIFALANSYLGLKTGTTISASIPAAILSMAIFKLMFKNSTILENNIVQTIATMGESMAAGVIFTIPALFFLGETPSIMRVFIISSLGGILGILFMIPMRRFIIVEEHKKLPFPEGTACAEILKAGEKGKTTAFLAASSFLTAALYKVGSNILFLWDEMINWTITPFGKTEFSLDATPALMGIGFIIGPRISALLLAGGALSWWVIIPLIRMFALNKVIIFPSTVPVELMSADDIWNSYVRYIGAGAVAIGGVLSLMKIFPIVIKTLKGGFKELFSGGNTNKNTPRTDKDISLAYLILGAIAIMLMLWLIPITSLNLFTVVLLVILAFFFVALTSITVGIVGSSSNPTSGMTITTLLIVCILFVTLGWTEKAYLISAITTSCVAAVAIAIAGTTSQDLKTGFLLGATPRAQQIAEILGIFLPGLILGSTIFLLNQAYHLGSIQMPAPQAVLVSMVAKGVMSHELPYMLVIIGIIIGLVAASLDIPVLPFAMGIYLPLSLNTAIMIGGLVALYAMKHARKKEVEFRGILISSGLVGGDAFMGILIALLTILGVIPPSKTALFPTYLSLSMYLLLALFITFLAVRKKKSFKDAF